MNQTHKRDSALAIEQERQRRLGEFFKAQRLKAGLSEAEIAKSLDLATDVYIGYEAGRLLMPLEDVFTLTNAMNVAPEEVMQLVHELYLLGSR